MVICNGSEMKLNVTHDKVPRKLICSSSTLDAYPVSPEEHTCIHTKSTTALIAQKNHFWLDTRLDMSENQPSFDTKWASSLLPLVQWGWECRFAGFVLCSTTDIWETRSGLGLWKEAGTLKARDIGARGYHLNSVCADGGAGAYKVALNPGIRPSSYKASQNPDSGGWTVIGHRSLAVGTRLARFLHKCSRILPASIHGSTLSGEVVKWEIDEEHLNAWLGGKTCVPNVGATMRQINIKDCQDRLIHMCMIVALFVSKDLMLNCWLGERLFMEKLTDGDRACNNGDWQWSRPSVLLPDLQSSYTVLQGKSNGKIGFAIPGEPSWSTLVDVTNQHLHPFLSGRLEGLSPDQPCDIISARSLQLRNVAKPYGRPTPASRQAAEAGSVTLADMLCCKSTEFTIAISARFGIDEIQAFVLLFSPSCTYLAWAFVLSRLTSKAGQLKEIPESYRRFLDSLHPHHNRSKEWEPSHHIEDHFPLGFVIAMAELFPVELITDFGSLVEIWIALFGRSECQSIAGICLQFWQSDWRQGLACRAMFDVTRIRLPIHFRPLIRLLRAMTASGFIHTDLLSTAASSGQPPADETQAASPSFAYTNLRAIHLPGGSVMPARSKGWLLSGDGGDHIAVCWQHEHGGWKVVLDMLTEYVTQRRMYTGTVDLYQDVAFGRTSPGSIPLTLRLEDVGMEIDEGDDEAQDKSHQEYKTRESSVDS
ncbi:uncharacterized protein F5147DRAFT_789516 [Suillus discolor]|uniref:Cryptochrome/DNA photolyase FAD-binding domain-containing protein n=1 Tax=Suillus discolor TaxID=1912936 RepID=A0A9P7ETI4_9AGAM|nr:uncharacterized protein F5147DRAFT_789516 [Suillus discolor]KAG2088377.1 hypothetical protein F5147DRAFT_789516 [Suillus discolor]